MKRPYYFFLGSTSAGMESGVLAQAPFKLEPHPEWSPLFRGSIHIFPKSISALFVPQSPPPQINGREGTHLQTDSCGQAKDQTTLTASKNKLAYCTIDIDGVVSSVFQSPAFIGSSITQLNVFNGQFTIWFCCHPCPRCRINLLTFVIEPTYVADFIF